jgi:hypothetical protein
VRTVVERPTDGRDNIQVAFQLCKDLLIDGFIANFVRQPYQSETVVNELCHIGSYAEDRERVHEMVIFMTNMRDAKEYTVKTKDLKAAA